MVDARSTLPSPPPLSRKRERGVFCRLHGGLRALRPLPRLSLLVLLMSLAAPSQALFGDEEARKAIVDLRDQVAQLQKDHAARIDELSQRMDRIDTILQAIQRGQLEAGGQIELNDKKSARATLSKIVTDFPDSDAAKLAKERLSSLGPK